MVRKPVIAILVILGIPTGLFLAYDALMLRSRPTPLAARDFWVCLGGALVILLLAAWGLRSLLRGQFRRKRMLKTAALAVTSFVFLIWQVSVVLDLGHRWQGGVWAFLSDGCLETGIDRSGRPASWSTLVQLPSYPPFISWEKIDWWPRLWWSRTGTWKAVRIPLWMPYLAALIPTISLFRRYRRFPSGFCHNCSYDLTGNTSGICPECGEVALRMKSETTL